MNARTGLLLLMLGSTSGCVIWYGADYFPGAQLKKILAKEGTSEPIMGRITATFQPAIDGPLAQASNGGYPLAYLGVKDGKVCFLSTGWGSYRAGERGGAGNTQAYVRASFADDRLVFQARKSLDEVSGSDAKWPHDPPTQVESIDVSPRSKKRVHNVLGVRGSYDPGTKVVYDVTMCGPAPAMDAETKYLTVMRLPQHQMAGMGGQPSLFVWMVDPTAKPEIDDSAPDAAGATTAPPADSNDVLGVLTKDGRFSLFIIGLGKAGLLDAVTGKDRVTVFAPTDAAFSALGPDPMKAVLAIDAQKLKEMLQNHIAAGAFPANQFTGSTAAHPTRLSTIAQKPLRVRKEKGKVFVENRPVIATDIKADNGVIHVVERLIDL